MKKPDREPAREKVLPLLSPYVDGELSPEARRQVEEHLAHDSLSAKLVDDLRAGDALIRHALDLEGDDVDWKAFTDGVMGRLTPEKPPFVERLKVSLTELFTWQRGPLVAGLAGAVAAVGIAIPVTMRLTTPDGYEAARVHVQTVAVETQANVTPEVIETDDGDAVIWVVDGPTPSQPDKARDAKGSVKDEEKDDGASPEAAPALSPKKGEL